MNNSELGSKTQCLGWDDVTVPVSPPRDNFGGPASLGTLCGDCLETSTLPLLLKSISTWLREITLPTHNNTSGSCSGNRSSRGWEECDWKPGYPGDGSVSKHLSCSREKRLLVLMSVSRSCVFVIWKPLFPRCCSAAPCWTSILRCFSKIIFKGLFS